MQRLIVKNFLFCISFYFYVPNLCADIIQSPKLYIEFNIDSSDKNDVVGQVKIVEDESENGPSSTKLKTACKLLGRGLKADGGAFGDGFFTNYKCLYKSPAATDSGWVLKIEKQSQRVHLNMFFAKNLQATANFVFSDKNFDLLTDPEFAQLLTTTLLDQLPARWRLTGLKEGINSLPWPTKLSTSWPVAKPEGELLIFVLSEKMGTFQASPRGKAKRRDEEGKSIWRAKIKKVAADDVLWAHNRHGRGAQCAELQSQIDFAATEVLGNNIVKKLMGLLPGSYVGLRFGFGITPDPLMRKLFFFGLLTELRSGRFTGLNYNYDKVPRAKYTNDKGQKLEFAMSQHTIGYTIPIRFGESPFSMEVRPKFGLLLMNAVLDDGGELFPFNLPVSNSFGMVVAFEAKQSRYMARLWLTQDYAVGVLRDSTNSEGTYSSFSYGINTYVDGPKIANALNSAFLLFVYNSTNTLKIKTVTDDSETVTYAQAFAGTGLSLTW